MLIYHGTSSRNIDAVLKDGLVPRDKLGTKSVWTDFPSRDDMVYLSRAYPFYFALNTAEGDEHAVVFEIETDRLDEELFFPDEDCIAQAIAMERKVPLKTIHQEIRDTLKDYQMSWRASVASMGNCCYGCTIPPAALTRMVIYDIGARPSLSMWVIDPCISILNYRFLGERYTGLVDWFFGDKAELPDEESRWLKEPNLEGKLRQAIEQRKAHLIAESKDRTGIEIREL